MNKFLFRVLSALAMLQATFAISGYSDDFENVCSPCTVGFLDGNRLYGSVFGGGNFATKEEIEGFIGKLDTGYLIGGAVGYNVFCNLRLEAEVAYRRNDINHLTVHLNGVKQKQPSSGDFESLDGMVNLIYDFSTCFCVQPYIGAGIGYAHNKYKLRVNQQGELLRSSHSKNGFAYQFIGGISYPILCWLDVALEYRFYKPNVRHFEDHNVVGCLRFHL